MPIWEMISIYSMQVSNNTYQIFFFVLYNNASKSVNGRALAINLKSPLDL